LRLRAWDNAAHEREQQRCQKNVAREDFAGRVDQHHRAVQQQEREYLPWAKRFCREHPGQGGPEKAENESAEETKDHHAHVRDSGIRLHAAIEVERP
jgi:hypothetical protein